MKTRILSIIVVIAVLSSCSKDNIEPVAQIAQEDNITLTQINPSEVPEGVEPLRFETLDEAKEYLYEEKKEIESHNESVQIFDDGKKDMKNMDFSKNTTHICSTIGSISWNKSLSAWIEYELDANNHFTTVNDITSHLTGLTWGSSYTQFYYTKTIAPDNVNFTIYGIIEYYVWIGTNMYYSAEPIQASGSFNQSCGGGGGASGGELPGDPEFE